MIAGLTRLLSPGGEGACLSVLIFHRVLPCADELMPSEPDLERFDEILRWLGTWYRVLPLDNALRQLREGRLPASSAAITFDDGYADNAEHALPVLRARGMPATFFIATGFLDGGRMFNDTIIESVRSCSLSRIDLGRPELDGLPLRTAEDRRLAIQRLIGQAKYLESVQRQQFVDDVHRACGSPLLPDDLMMTSAQLGALRDAGMQIGAHTRNHPILARLPDERARAEIDSGKRDLETLLGQEVNVFAYPNGTPGMDYLAQHVSMVREAGFEWAVSTASGAMRRDLDPLQVPRFTPWDRVRHRFGARLLVNLRTPVQVVPAIAKA